MLKLSLNIYLVWFVLYFYMLNLFRYPATTKGIILNIWNKFIKFYIALYVFHVSRNMTIARRLECRLNLEFICGIQSSTYFHMYGSLNQ